MIKRSFFLFMMILLLCLTAAGPARASEAFDKALEAAQKGLASERLRDLRQSRANALNAGKAAVTAEERERAAAILEEVLVRLTKREGIPPQERLTLLLQAAGTYGIRKDFKAMDRRIAEALNEVAEADTVTRINAFWDAAAFYVNSRDYETARLLTARKDALLERAQLKNVYNCGFIPIAPRGADAWSKSDLIRAVGNRDARFQPYPPDGEGYMLEADMAADRPLTEAQKDAALGRGTSFFMAGGPLGWHIYIETGEPDVEQIMLGDGAKGSTLEIFFAPGLKDSAYYQWTINLATGAVNIYNWNSPHRYYRHLENKPGGFQTDTVMLSGGWGTAIFIPWEALYDRLPFIEGQDNTWRFTIIRWGPVRTTWSGKVHQTGSWGQVSWRPPAPEQRLAIERRLIGRAWWQYQAAAKAAEDYWKSPIQGDPAFYESFLEPLLAGNKEYADSIKTLKNWEGQRVEDVFRDKVPGWMEFAYEVDALRERYLLQKIVATGGK